MDRRNFIASVLAIAAAPFAWGKRQMADYGMLTPGDYGLCHKRSIEGNQFCTNLHLSNNFINPRPSWIAPQHFYSHAPTLKDARVDPPKLSLHIKLDGKEYAAGLHPINKRNIDLLFDAGKHTALDLLGLLK